MLIVVSYDVPGDRRRARLAHVLKDYGARVQFSVFECLLDADDLERLQERLARLIDVKKDRLRIYRLCESCRAKVVDLGQGEVTEDPDAYVL